MRQANKIETEEITRFYKESTNDDYDGFRIGVIDNYVSDCPGYCGSLYFLLGGFPGAYVLLCRNKDGEVRDSTTRNILIRGGKHD